jgi:hypothetical protein
MCNHPKSPQDDDGRGEPHPYGFFAPLRLCAFAFIFFAFIFAANLLVRTFCNPDLIDCSPTFPLSVFYLRLPEFSHVMTALIVAGCFIFATRHLTRINYRLPVVIFWGIILVLGSNLIQGWERGFAVPVAGEPLTWTVAGTGHEYYHDARSITAPLTFIAEFNVNQRDLGVHSETHPPGAVLTLWLLRQITPDPAMIGILMAVISVSLSAIFLHSILRAEIPDAAGYGTWLYLLIPAAQIYSAASLDAIIAPLLLGVVYSFAYLPGWKGWLLTFGCLWLASWLTFGFVFALPALLGVEWLRWRTFHRTMVYSLALGLVYVLLRLLFGFDYLRAFQTAAAIENPDGFRLLSNAPSYLITRLENILEICVFLTPFLLLKAGQGVRQLHRLNQLTGLAVATLLAMFIAGAFKTGETARACLFIFPYLLFPAILNANATERGWLAGLVCGQAILMQLFGVYFW